MIASTTTYWHSTTAATTDVYVAVDKEHQPAAEPERDTGRRVPVCERLHRRLATVTGLRRNRRPPQQASTYG